MGEPRSFRNSPSSRVENQLKTIKLTARKIEKERVAIVYLGMNERCCNSFSCSGIESISDTITRWHYSDRIPLSTVYWLNYASCQYRYTVLLHGNHGYSTQIGWSQHAKPKSGRNQLKFTIKWSTPNKHTRNVRKLRPNIGLFLFDSVRPKHWPK